MPRPDERMAEEESKFNKKGSILLLLNLVCEENFHEDVQHNIIFFSDMPLVIFVHHIHIN